jgi:hypothetical protein
MRSAREEPMAATYNALAFSALAMFLKGLGFTPSTIKTKEGHEVVFERRHHGDDQLIVLVYTSVALPTKPASDDLDAIIAAAKNTVRKKGKDAIRVCLVCESDRVKAIQEHYGQYKADGRLGLSSAKRIHRAGTEASIFGRIQDRARDMYRLANQMHREAHCTCGAPLFPDTGKCILRGYCPDKPKATEAA